MARRYWSVLVAPLQFIPHSGVPAALWMGVHGGDGVGQGQGGAHRGGAEHGIEPLHVFYLKGKGTRLRL